MFLPMTLSTHMGAKYQMGTVTSGGRAVSSAVITSLFISDFFSQITRLVCWRSIPHFSPLLVRKGLAIIISQSILEIFQNFTNIIFEGIALAIGGALVLVFYYLANVSSSSSGYGSGYSQYSRGFRQDSESGDCICRKVA